MEKDSIRALTDQRPFTMLYDDFLESDVLTIYEKMVFICLKRYANKENQCFPSLNTLTRITGLSKRKIQDCIKSMIEKGVVTKEAQNRESGAKSSNLYTLYDRAEIWQKKKPESDIAKESESGAFQKSECVTDNTAKPAESQERYPMDDIKSYFDYDVIAGRVDRETTDAVFNVLYDALNTTKPALKAAGQDRPVMVVIGKLMKLDYNDIIFVIEQYHKQTDRITNASAYILTQLYSAKEQNHLDLMNLGHHNGDF